MDIPCIFTAMEHHHSFSKTNGKLLRTKWAMAEPPARLPRRASEPWVLLWFHWAQWIGIWDWHGQRVPRLCINSHK